MTITEYKEIINKTAVYPQQVNNFGIAYCVLGLFDELAEFLEKLDDNISTKDEIKKEVGDVFWYICALCNELNLDFENIVLNPKHDKKYSPLLLFGLTKKYYRDSKLFDAEQLTNILKCFIADTILKFPDINILEILELNYNKLIKRRETNTIQGDGDNREES